MNDFGVENGPKIDQNLIKKVIIFKLHVEMRFWMDFDGFWGGFWGRLGVKMGLRGVQEEAKRGKRGPKKKVPRGRF